MKRPTKGDLAVIAFVALCLAYFWHPAFWVFVGIGMVFIGENLERHWQELLHAIRGRQKENG